MIATELCTPMLRLFYLPHALATRPYPHTLPHLLCPIFSFVLNPVRIFSGSFGGGALWQNSAYITPNTVGASDTSCSHFNSWWRRQYLAQACSFDPLLMHFCSMLSLFSSTPTTKSYAMTTSPLPSFFSVI